MTQIPDFGVGNKEAKAEILQADACRLLEYDSIPSAMLAPTGVVVPFLTSPFLKMFRGPIYISAPSAMRVFLQDMILFAQNQGAWLQESDNSAFFKATRVHGAILFCFRKVCKRSLSPQSQTQVLCETDGCFDASHVLARRSAPSPPKNRGKRGGKNALHAANAFWRFRESGRSRGETRPGSSPQRRKHSWRPWSRQQVITKAKIQERASPHLMGDISSWFTERAFSNQSGQGGSATTDHHREARQASCHREQAIDHPTEKHVGVVVRNVHNPRPASSGDRSVCVWFKAKKTEKYLRSLTIHTWSLLHQVLYFIHTALMFTGATVFHPEDHK